jgi:hypothetical protein
MPCCQPVKFIANQTEGGLRQRAALLFPQMFRCFYERRFGFRGYVCSIREASL